MTKRAGLAVVVSTLVLLLGCSQKPRPPRRAAGDGAGAAFGPPCEVLDRSDGALPEVTAARVASGAVVLDGSLDEEIWRVAACAGGFVNPGGGAPEPGSRVNGAAWFA
jgi:hypothetical protein